MDDFFSIQAERFDGDKSFLATLRALLYERSEGESVRLVIKSVNVTGIRSHTFYDYSERFKLVYNSDFFARNTLALRYLVSSVEDNRAALEMFDDPEHGFVHCNPSFRELDDLRVFAHKRAKLDARFYIDEERRQTLIVTDCLDFAGFHFLQSLIPRLFPWFFKDAPVDELEFSLLDSLTQRTSTEYERILAQLAECIDLRGFEIRSLIGDFERAGRREEIEQTKRKIDEIRETIRNIEVQYRDILTQLENRNLILCGQEAALENMGEGSELIDYFICNRSLIPTGTSGRRMMFMVKTFLESFDPDQYDTFIRNEGSHLYTGYNVPENFKDIKTRRRLLDAIFSDEPVLKVKMCSNYTIDLTGFCTCEAYYDYRGTLNDYIPNPHIHKFACLGNHAQYIDNRIQAGDLVGAVEQCVSSAKSLNLSEPPTVRFFLHMLFETNKKVLRLPDGRDVTPTEALLYLDALDAQKEDAQNNA